jgi:hypothetical protein
MRSPSRPSIWDASGIPIVVAAVVVTRLLRVALECLGREVAHEAAGTLGRATRGNANRQP